MRAFGRYTTTLWQDPDFTSLTFEQQGVYFMLGLQPDITAAGTLALTTGRWRRNGAGCSRSHLESLIGALSASDGRHVITDEDSEELIVRKFIKWDEGWKNSKRVPVIFAALRTVRSVHIRDIAVEELHAISTGIAHTDTEKQARDTVSRYLDVYLKDAVTGFDRLRTMPLSPSPLTFNQNPLPGAVAADTDDPLSPFCSKHQPNGTEEPCGPCATRGLAYRRRIQQQAQADLDARAERQARADAAPHCPHCQGGIWRIDDPTIKCDHQPAPIGADQ